MKKRICAMALTLALAAGGLSLASDLNLTTILNFDIILYLYFLQGGNFMNKKKLTLLLVQLEHLLGFLCL